LGVIQSHKKVIHHCYVISVKRTYYVQSKIMSVISKINSPAMYIICGSIIAFIAVFCIVFLIRAYKTGIAIGMDKVKMKRAITSSATFTILPSIGILLGVIALSGSLGTPLPWLRLSVIGALHYETQVAEAAAEVTGLTSLSGSEMTETAFVTIALLMSFCIMWGIVLSIFFNKRYMKKIQKPKKVNSGEGFANTAMTAMFIGLVSAYIGSYIGGFVSGNGLLSFSGKWLPLIVVTVSALTMSVFIWISEKKKAAWVDNFSIAGSMIIGMASAVITELIIK